MRKITIYRILAVLVTATIFFAACTKEPSNIKFDPKLSTSQVLNVKSDSATVVGFVVAAGDGFTERGVCYDIAEAPTTAMSKVIYTENITTATFSVKLGGLSYATKYYARAYAIGASGTIYGEEITFTTLPVVPSLTSAAITVITGNSATGGGNVTVTGGAAITARGICYDTNHNPTIAKTKTTDGTGAGAFVSALTSLSGFTTYYVRAYATNSAGTGYGPEVTFKTLVDFPVVTTAAVTGITKVAAISGGEVTKDGGSTVTTRGLAWGTSANPTTADNIIADATGGIGVFVSNLTGLTKNTTYHVRAYATNSKGTSYGSDIEFKTENDLPTVGYIVGSINGWNNHGQYLYAKGSNVFLGYQYLDATSEFKFFPQRDSWDNGWGQGATAGTLVSGGGNIKASDLTSFGYTAPGFYEVKFDCAGGTVALTSVTMGVIGDAQAGGWGTDVNLTYNTGTKKWEGQVTFLATGEFKFRANDDWAITFGVATTNLIYNGGNMPTPGAGLYDIVLDLSGADNFNATVTLH